MWHPVEHKVWTFLKDHELHEQPKYLVAVSGGLDSIVLLSILKNLRPKAQIHVVHCHHGNGENQSYRDSAEQLMVSVCQQWSVQLHFYKSDQSLKTEAECREFRQRSLQKTLQNLQLKFYFTAHHKDDALETYLLKMIRGTGIESLSEFKIWNGKVCRPLMLFDKGDIKKYAISQNLKWVDDPTNEESVYFRNWIRNQWLPQLNEFSPGATSALHRSFENIVEAGAELKDRFAGEMNNHILQYGSSESFTIDRFWWMSLSENNQMKVLIYTLQHRFKRDISMGTLKEIKNLLDKNQNEHTFTQCGLNWVIHTDKFVIALK